MKTFGFACLAVVASWVAAAAGSNEQYITFQNGLVVNTYKLDGNNTQISVKKYDENGQAQGTPTEGAAIESGIVDFVDFPNGIHGRQRQIINGIKKAIQDGFAAAQDGEGLIQKIQDMVKTGGVSLTDSQALVTTIQNLLQDVLKLFDAQPKVCRRCLIGRGVGTIPDVKCEDDKENILGLCYPVCKNDFESVLGFICRKKGCGGVDGAVDMGISCTKPAAYGRGVGHIHEDKCKSQNSQGCEKNGLLWYPKCKAGYHAFGCCVCTPDCPAGFNDDGAYCRKESYTRAGTIRSVCPADKVNSVGLCYKPCEAKQDGLGPICTPQCTGDAPSQCGLFCTSTAAACASATVELVGDGTKILLSAIGQDFTGVIKSSIQLGQYIIEMGQCQES
ncbi:hypothetical protein LEN26_003417 [Aphanomyces euteiches]|nr:hypothetical protein AeMF1_019506 [Aphanomyces euteiches]KAH9154333.1 hypothetical protein LEN26_003417 [Aphanomyces euteiches]KAH9181178.1 hypothetical protein AeNC1_016846 [Aphanomyces euteiches]